MLTGLEDHLDKRVILSKHCAYEGDDQFVHLEIEMVQSGPGVEGVEVEVVFLEDEQLAVLPVFKVVQLDIVVSLSTDIIRCEVLDVQVGPKGVYHIFLMFVPATCLLFQWRKLLVRLSGTLEFLVMVPPGRPQRYDVLPSLPYRSSMDAGLDRLLRTGVRPKTR